VEVVGKGRECAVNAVINDVCNEYGNTTAYISEILLG
jgi:hypothetical protein